MHRIILIFAFTLLGQQQLHAATATANISANVLKPVYVSMQQPSSESRVAISSIQLMHYDLSHKASDVCLLADTQSHNTFTDSPLAMAQCESYTVNFN
ncbi:MAG: hypothetical protein HUJ29_13985 [Gammaproteobacteria bacterium]|nr:hypothetical protein [Gammaproteobacteria bacterium]